MRYFLTADGMRGAILCISLSADARPVEFCSAGFSTGKSSTTPKNKQDILLACVLLANPLWWHFHYHHAHLFYLSGPSFRAEYPGKKGRLGFFWFWRRPDTWISPSKATTISLK